MKFNTIITRCVCGGDSPRNLVLKLICNRSRNKFRCSGEVMPVLHPISHPSHLIIATAAINERVRGKPHFGKLNIRTPDLRALR